MIINWDDECLKALIASRVFGQRVEYMAWPWDCRPAMLVIPLEGFPTRVPDYPNDIGAAWEVVDWMLAQEWEVCLEGTCALGWGGYIYARTLEDDGQSWNECLAGLYVPTAPRAICEAALRALEATGGD